jgi:rhodanese-related sulfurtransferase
MEKRTTACLVLLFASLLFAEAQTDFDKKLKSLYRNSVATISPNELLTLMDSGVPVVLLDIRSPEEYGISHIRTANFLDYGSFNTRMVDKLNKDSPIIVYCSVGYRSERVGEKLKSAGFKNVKNLYGGIFQWVNEGLPVVNKKDHPTDSVHTYNKNWSQWLTKGIKVY